MQLRGAVKYFELHTETILEKTSADLISSTRSVYIRVYGQRLGLKVRDKD
jgi:hypothetical protein